MTGIQYASDCPAESDSFGRGQFAKSLANALLCASRSDGFVIGIEGEWGTGKSTVIALAKAELLEFSNKDSGPIVVEFNPWMIASADALVEALIVQIASSIGGAKNAADEGLKISQKLIGYARLLKNLKYFKYAPGMSFAGQLAEDLGAAAEAASEGTQAASSALDDLKSVLPSLNLTKRKADISTALRELGRPVIVVIDDLDRLSAEEIRVVVHPRDILRLINRLLISLPATQTEVNVADVLVFEALSQRYPSLRKAVHEHPEDFVGQRFRDDIDHVSIFTWDEWALNNDPNGKSPAWERHLPQDDPAKKAIADACSFLFKTPGSDRGDATEDKLRLAGPNRLARYFRMCSLENVPEARTMHMLLREPSSLVAEINDIPEPELGFRLQWLSNYAPSCVSPDIKGSVEALIHESSCRAAEGSLSADLTKDFEDLVLKLIRTAEEPVRAELILKLMTSAPLGIAEHVLLYAAAEQGMWVVRPELQKAEGHRLVEDRDCVNAALKTWSSRVLRAVGSGVLQSEAPLARLNSSTRGQVKFPQAGQPDCRLIHALAAISRQRQ